MSASPASTTTSAESPTATTSAPSKTQSSKRQSVINQDDFVRRSTRTSVRPQRFIDTLPASYSRSSSPSESSPPSSPETTTRKRGRPVKLTTTDVAAPPGKNPSRSVSPTSTNGRSSSSKEPSPQSRKRNRSSSPHSKKKKAAAEDDDDDIDDEEPGDSSPPSNVHGAKAGKKLRKVVWDPTRTRELAMKWPDSYFTVYEGDNFIDKINADTPLRRVRKEVSHPGFVYSAVFSPNGAMLATTSSFGSVRLWDTSTWALIGEYRDPDERNIEEFYVVQFSPDCTKLIAAGKLKDRYRWSDDEDDNVCIPGPIKIFDCATGNVVAKLEGHTEEILCLKVVPFEGSNYLLSCSQDGYLYKWQLNKDFTGLIYKQRFDDMSSNMVFSFAFIPDCGNKYFIGACDDHLKLFDFETAKILLSFEPSELYTCYCDCVKFIRPPPDRETAKGEYYLITRGVELLVEGDADKTVRPNCCHLLKLTVPLSSRRTNDPTVWKLEVVHSFSHPEYAANSWPLHIAATRNGRYIAAPTADGRVFIWNIWTRQVVGMLDDHEEREVRDIAFHPSKKIVVTCGNDSSIKVYVSGDPKEFGWEEAPPSTVAANGSAAAAAGSEQRHATRVSTRRMAATASTATAAPATTLRRSTSGTSTRKRKREDTEEPQGESSSRTTTHSDGNKTAAIDTEGSKQTAEDKPIDGMLTSAAANGATPQHTTPAATPTTPPVESTNGNGSAADAVATGSEDEQEGLEEPTDEEMGNGDDDWKGSKGKNAKKTSGSTKSPPAKKRKTAVSTMITDW